MIILKIPGKYNVFCSIYGTGQWILNIIFIINSGALNGRLSIDALNVRRIVGDNLALLVQSTSTLICGIVIAMVADWKLSLVILFVIPLVGLQGYAQVKFLQGFSQDAKVSYKLAFYTFLFMFQVQIFQS